MSQISRCKPLVIDGGIDGDFLYALGGDKVEIRGGPGRDFIFNTSEGGVSYGNSRDGQGGEEADLFWFWPGTTIKDADNKDFLQFYGMPLTGGTNNIPMLTVAAAGGGAGAFFQPILGLAAYKAGEEAREQGFSPLYFDQFAPFINYIQKGEDLYVVNGFNNLIDLFDTDLDPTQTSDGVSLKGALKVEKWEGVVSYWGIALDIVTQAGQRGDLNMVFKKANPFLAALAMLPPILGGLNNVLPFVDEVLFLKASATVYAESVKWRNPDDPLVLDLDGDGFETTRLENEEVYFDLNGDFFSERAGWIDADDGILALDKNANGSIDDISELFGNANQGGFDELALYDVNGDGVIDAGDAMWSELRVWRDANLDGVSDDGKLISLDELGIVSIETTGNALDVTTPEGALLRKDASFTWANGQTGQIAEAIFELDEVDTRYLGENGTPPWLAGNTIEAKGFGGLTNLGIAAANDFELGELLNEAAATMTTPQLKLLREQSGEVIGKWAFSLEQSRELTPVLLTTDAEGAVTLADRGVYVEDATGGYWTLKSGQPVLDELGAVINRPTLEHVLAQATAAGQIWRVEQGFSSSSRSSAPQFRDNAPYLVEIVDGRAVIHDYAFKNDQGAWQLASGAPILDVDGNAIADPSVDDILAMAAAAGQQWRIEDIQVNPYAGIAVEHIGVNFIDGVVVDYTVEITDRDGTFYVWARNLDRALELQAKTGTAREFNLRNYEIDFDALDEVGSTDDSQFRVELLTPGQFHFATSLIGIDFRPEMLSAAVNETLGTIDYDVNGTGNASISQDEFDSGISTMIEMVGTVMEQYIVLSRSLAVRMALQGGLKDFARDLEYVVENDTYRSTSDRQMMPVFDAIFESVPAGYDAAYDYLTEWAQILWFVYTNYQMDGSKNQLGVSVLLDQAFIFQNMLPAFENIPTDLDLEATMNALSLDETMLVSHAQADTDVDGTEGTNFFYMSEGNQTFRGGFGADYYFVGKDFGTDYIYDQDTGEVDELRFTDIYSDDVIAIRDGMDLILEITGRDDVLRLTDQFLGELNPLFTNGKRGETGVSSIVFADGEIWDRFRMAFEVADPQDTNDPYYGTGEADVLWGGKGNDYLSGNWGGDIYVYERGDGQDVIDDAGGFSFGPAQAGFDFLQFKGDISSDDLKLIRDGASPDLQIILLDAEGNETTDTILIKEQFGGMVLNLQAFGAISADLGIDYVAPSLIETFIFGDGTSINFEEMSQRVLSNARTDGDDAIYGFLNGNTLDGGAGNDYITGVAGSDTYIFGRGYGQDVIEDNDLSSKLFGNSPDTIRFTDDLRWTDFEFIRDGSSDTLTLRIEGTDDELILVDYLEYIFLIYYTNQIETIEFADGTEWSANKLLQHFVDVGKTTGDDHIYGFERTADGIDGGAGNDRLEGLGGNDTYWFARGYGQDTISDLAQEDPSGLLPPGPYNGGEDQVVFQGINAADVDFSRTDLDLIITVTDTGDQVILENQYVRDYLQGYAVEYFEFADGTLEFTNFNPEDLDLVGNSADETITGSNFAEVLDGRAGNDTLIGRDGGDTYKFDVGYGQDVIVDTRERAAWRDRQGFDVPVDDVVEFGDDINRDNIVFTKDGNDLVISVLDRTDTLRIRDQFIGTVNGVERFEFQQPLQSGNPNVLLISDVYELLQIAGGNRGDNIIEGVPDQPNTLDGRQGDDTLIGGTAADTYAFGADYDFDQIEEAVDQAGVIDRVIFGATVSEDVLKVRRDGDDLLIDLGAGTDVLRIVDGLTTRKIEEFHFADGGILTIEDLRDLLLQGTDGDDELIGFDNRNDLLAGRAGSDALFGKTGDDTYTFGFGDGRDSITETGGIDQIRFGVGVTRDQIAFSIIASDILIKLTGTGETLVILNGAGTNTANQVESFVFESGESLTLTELLTLIRSETDNTGQNIIKTGALDTSTDVLPGLGMDTVELSANARVVFNAGDGIDQIKMPGSVAGAQVFFSDLLSSDAVVRNGDLLGRDLVIAFPETGDQVVLVDGLLKSELPVILFGDGEAWDRAALIDRLIAAQVGPDADLVFGSSLADTIDAGAGDDDVRGGGGDDTFRFTRGDGRDVISDSSGTDRLEILGYQPTDVTVTKPVTDRDELLLSFAGTDDEILIRYQGGGVDIVAFSDGTEWTLNQLQDVAIGQGTPFDDDIVGNAAPNTLVGNAGNDALTGGPGNDVYFYARGDGRDIINDDGYSNDVNRLEIRDYVPADATLVRYDDRPGDLTIRFSGGDEIIIVGGLVENGRHITTIAFQDGTEWSVADALQVLDTQRQPQLDETLLGTADAETLAGGGGNDLLTGVDGSDIYIFRRGDGHDTIFDQGWYDTDILRIEGYAPAELIPVLSSTIADSVDIRFQGTSDRLTIVNTLDNSPSDQIEQIQFDDGTVWSMADLKLNLIEGQQSAGNDTVTAFVGADALEGGLGDDTLSGRDGSDTYLFRRGDGQDVIDDNGNGDTDILRIEGYAPSEVSLAKSQSIADSVILTFTDSDDRITIVNTLDNSPADQIEQVVFDDGTVWSMADGRLDLISGQQTDGNNQVTGFIGADTITAGLGDDQTFGGDGSDTYIFRRGDGHDTIDDNGNGDTDVLRIEGYTPAEVRLSHSLTVADTVELRFIGTEDRITIINTLDNSPADQIEQIVFDDGTVWTIADLKLELIAQQQTDGDDLVTGFIGADTLAGGLGNDELQGRDGSDTYVFRRGDGQDVIDDNGNGDTDVVRIEGYTPAEVELSASRVDASRLIIAFRQTDDQIAVVNALNANAADQIEEFHFDDGTVWSIADIQQFLVDQSGTPVGETLVGDAVADSTLNGGPGDDSLDGGGGGNTYIYARGDGNDVIYEDDNRWGAGAPGVDRLVLTDISQDDVALRREGLELHVNILSTGESVTVAYQYYTAVAGNYGIDQIEFSDGSVWDRTSIEANVGFVGNDGDDNIDGSASDDVVEGRGGNDRLDGAGGGNTYIYSLGDGSDVIFEDDNKWGAGAPGFDRIVFTDINPGEIALSRSGTQLLIDVLATGDQVTVQWQYYSAPPYGIEEFEFADGTIWDRTQIDTISADPASNPTGPVPTVGTPGDDVISTGAGDQTIIGLEGDDDLSGGSGNDTYIYNRGDGHDVITDTVRFGTQFDTVELRGIAVGDVSVSNSGATAVLSIAETTPGAGDDGTVILTSTLDNNYEYGIESVTFDDGTTWTRADLRQLAIAAQQTTGDDRITGFVANDTFESGLGDDFVAGRDGNDTYIYNRGDGDDVFSDTVRFGTQSDTVELRGIAVSDVRVSNDGTDALLTIAESAPGAGDGGSVNLAGTLDENYNHGIEFVTFDDGTTWSRADLRQLVLVSNQTAGDDVINGFIANDTIEAGLGNDLVVGGDGNDTYIYNRGDGDDVIKDTVQFGTQSDTVQLRGIAIGDVNVTYAGNDAVLKIAESAPGAGDGGSLFLVGTLAENYNYGIEFVTFDDGTQWTRNHLRQFAIDAQQTTGNDLIGGFAGDLLNLAGGPGDDVLRGGDGSSIYVFGRGDGQDLVDDNGRDDIDVVRIQGYTPDEIRLSRGVYTTNNLIIEFTGTDDRLEIHDTLNNSRADQIEELHFEDGTVWTIAEVKAKLLEDRFTDYDDNLVGTNVAEILIGGPGNDQLSGDAGDDTYIYTRGDGYDLIIDPGSASLNDQLQLFGITPDQVIVGRRLGDDLELLITESTVGAGDAGRITVRSSFLATSTVGLGRIVFEDGTVWTRDTFEALAVRNVATIGDDRLTGTTGDDALAGLAGNDLLIGGEGGDTYLYSRGDGFDTIHDGGLTSDVDRLEITGYTRSEVSFSRRGASGEDLVIRLAEANDEIVIIGALATNTANHIESIVISDEAITLTLQDILPELIANIATSGDDTVIGTTGDDTIAGGLGNDLLDGGEGSDIYIYHAGDGDDRVSDTQGAVTTIELPDYAVDDVVYALRAGPESLDLVIRFSGERDRLIIEDALAVNSYSSNATQVVFSDGQIWDEAAMRARALSDVDTVINDEVYGFASDDIFEGNSGDDLLSGASGADTYRFSRGDGNDTINDAGTDAAVDRIEFENFVSSEVSVERLFKGSDSIVLTFASSDSDTLTVYNALSQDNRAIEQYVFTDGVTWDQAQIESRLDNNRPVATADGPETVATGDVLTILASKLLRNDFDADGDDLTIIAVDGGANGVAQLNQNGNVEFTANTGFSGLATITYTVSDGRNGLAEGRVDVRVNPLAEARYDDGFLVDEDGFLTIETERLLSNDVDGDRMVVAQVFDTEGGIASLSSTGEISFTPTPDFNGTASFTYVANTPEGGRAEAQVFIEVAPVNDPPIAVADAGFTTLEDVPFQIDTRDLIANDLDVDGDALVVSAVTSSADLDVELTDDGYVIVNPRDYFFGDATFSYVIADPSGLSSTGIATVSVTPVNNAPEPQADIIDTDAGEPIREDNPVVISFDALLANDIDRDNDTLQIVQVLNDVGGTARILDNQTILFTPTEHFFGDATFDYIVDDGQGGQATGQATVVYQAVNDVPVARDDSYRNEQLALLLNGLEDNPIEIPIVELLKNDFDIEGFDVTFESANNAVNGDIEITDHGTIIFTPDQDYWGPATFNYLVSDPQGGVDGATVELYFENVGDAPPVAALDEIYVFEDVPTLIPVDILLANDTDIDRDPLDFVGWRYPTLFDFGAQPLNGTLTEDADGNILFTPDLNKETSSGFVYEITDNRDGSTEGLVDIIIIPINDEPTAVADDAGSTPLDVPLVIRVSDIMANDFDVDADDVISFVGVDSVTDGTFEVVDVAGETFITVRFDQGFTGDVTIQYRIADLAGIEDIGFISASVAPTYDGVLEGTPLIDLLIGNNLDETIRGLASADAIEAGGGADQIDGGVGADQIDAGAGDDWIIGGDDGDTIDGGEGFDTVDFDNSNIGVRADLASRVGQGGHAQGDVYLNVEALAGTEFGDTLSGDGEDNRLDGRLGADRLEGRDGADILLGGEGDDTLEGGSGADTLEGGTGSDTADYFLSDAAVDVSLANGTASGGHAEGDILTSVENLIGSDFGDTLEGDDAANLLRGGRGDDDLIGGAGDDTLIGGRGADNLSGGAGTDIADYALSNDGVTIDMVDGSAGNGDAAGDTFTDIEIVSGSFQDDVIRGDGTDNVLRGRRGADLLDGRGGFDTADYTGGDEAVSVDLSLGQGLAGEALGDTLISIEMLRGTSFADTFVGSAGNDTFDGGFGDDVLNGGLGSDHYLFGYDSGADTVNEAGDAADVDRVVMGDLPRPKDVSIVRQGDDLLIELERDGGFLIDTMLVTSHFIDRESGIEEIAFFDGTVWDRAIIESLARVGRFNANDDIYRLAVEDEIATINTADLIANDAEEGIDQLEVISVQNAIKGTATLNTDGTISFLGNQDVNGDAFFEYTVRDQFGRESTAEVEVNIAPVNDAPIGYNDGVFYGTEDIVLELELGELLGNDFDIDGDQLDIDGSGFSPLYDDDGNALGASGQWNATFGDAAVKLDLFTGLRTVTFAPSEDHFGFAGFTYTLKDPDGLTSTATVELFINPVNDAPRSGADDRTIRLDKDNVITIASLLGNDYDPEGDAFEFVGVHSPTNGTISTAGLALDPPQITFTADELGQASFQYDLLDARGAASTITVVLEVIPLNDPPQARNDSGFTILEDETLVIDPSELLANDYDPNGDVIVVDSVERFPLNGKVAIDDQDMIVFTPRSDYNGEAGFVYTITDGRGGYDEAFVAITVLPSNDPAILRDDVVQGLEDEPIYIIAAEAFGNDIEPDGDVIFFEDAFLIGLLDNPVVRVSAEQTDGSELPTWLNFNADTLTFQGTMPASVTAALDVTITFTYPQDDIAFTRALSFAPSDAAALEDGIVYDGDLAATYNMRQPYSFGLELNPETVPAGVVATAALVVADESGSFELPAWLSFDPATWTFSGTPPAGVTESFDVAITLSDPALTGTEDFVDTLTIDPSDVPALNAGVAYDSDVSLLDLGAKLGVSASLASGRPLPDWLDFNADDTTLSFTELAPEPDADPARVQVTFETTTYVPYYHDDDLTTFQSSPRKVTLEFLIDPHQPLDPAINALLAGDGVFTNNSRLGIDLSDATSIVAQKESRVDLPTWLSFDAETLSFAGVPPITYVGAVPVRLDIEGDGADLPNFSIITDLVIDETYPFDRKAIEGVNSEFGLTFGPERIDLFRPEDFNGAVVLGYNTTDEKGAVTTQPGVIVVNVLPQPEIPDPEPDTLQAIEDETLTFALADLLANDRDDDGDDFRAIAFSQPQNGQLVLQLATLLLAVPATLPVLPGGIYTATLDDGSELPIWMAIDAATGTIEATPPLDVKIELSIVVSVTDGVTTESAQIDRAFDGNLGAQLVYTPDPSYSGTDTFTYTITDDKQGAADGTVDIEVAPVNDPPIATKDRIDGLEDTVLSIDPAVLLANDIDVDGDVLALTGVFNAVNGAVVLENGQIAFTPTANFDGLATFDYTVSDGTDGESTGLVEVNVISTNQAPDAVTDVFDAVEDQPLTITIADILANDGDPDGDQIEFVSITESVDQANAFILPGGRIQFVPDENENGVITFSYLITDGRLQSTGSIELNFAAVNDGPIAIQDGVYTGNEDEQVVIDLAELLLNDVDVEGDAFSVTAVFDGDNGTVEMVGDTAVFTPRSDYFGNAGFTYRVTDERGAESTGYVAITLLPTDDLPIAVVDTGFEVLEDSFIDIDPADLMANDYDPDGDQLVFLGLSGFGASIEELSNGLFQVRPNADFFGELVLSYAITDGSGFPVPSTVTINVLPVSDAPFARDDELAMVEDTPLTIFKSQLLDNDGDVDFQAIILDSVFSTDGVSITDNGVGQLIITPDADFNGTASFEYEIKDSTGLSARATVSITVESVNDAPVIGEVPALEGTEDVAFLASLPSDIFSDADGDAITVSLRGKDDEPLPAWLTFDPSNLTISGQPPQDFNGDIELELEHVRFISKHIQNSLGSLHTRVDRSGLAGHRLLLAQHQRFVPVPDVGVL